MNSIEKLIKFRGKYPKIKLIGVGSGDNRVYDKHIDWEDREILIKLINS